MFGLFLASIILSVCIINSVAEAKQAKPYDIPLSASVQRYVIRKADKAHISPELIFAMMEVESQYTEDKVGDSGNSIGLMQIQPRWHKDRMDRLNVTDLKDGKQNAKVGIDILTELFGKYEEVIPVLMAYNGGEYYMKKLINKGIYSTDYVDKVLDAQSRIYQCMN